MKRAYEKAMVKVTLFDNSDVVTTSGMGENTDDDCYGSHKNDKHQNDDCVHNPGFKNKN